MKICNIGYYGDNCYNYFHYNNVVYYLGVEKDGVIYDLITGDKVEDRSKLHSGTTNLFYKYINPIDEKDILSTLRELNNPTILDKYKKQVEKFRLPNECKNEEEELMILFNKFAPSNLLDSNKHYYEVLYNGSRFYDVNGDLIPFFAYEKDGVLRDMITNDLIAPIDANMPLDCDLFYTECTEISEEDLVEKLKLIEKNYLVSEYVKQVNLSKAKESSEKSLEGTSYILSFMKKYNRNYGENNGIL